MTPDQAFAGIVELHEKRRRERVGQTESPAEHVGRVLGCDGPLTLERLVCDPMLGALTASPTQRALLCAADGGSFELPKDKALFHFNAERLPSGRPRIVVLRTGVRAGKTLISALALLLSVLTCRFRRRPTEAEIARGVQPAADGLVGVRPGELVRAVIVAPKLKLARSPFQHLIGTMQASPKLKALFAEEPNKESCIIRRPDGRDVLIELVAADAGGAGLRSTWLAGALFDEADFHDDEDGAVNLTENVRACRPRMLDGAQIWIPSSPWAEGSPFDKLFQEAFKEQGKDQTIAFHSDSRSMFPGLDLAEEEAERRRDPDNAAREYDAIPIVAGGSSFFPADAITKSVSTRTEPLPPLRGVTHYSGADWGFTKNSATLALSRYEDAKVRVAFHEELRPTRTESLVPKQVVERFARKGMEYGAKTIRGDNYISFILRPEFEAFRDSLPEEQRGRAPVHEAWSPDRDAQAALFTELRRRMLEGRVELPNDPRLVAQMKATKSVALPGGATKIVLPRQGQSHGDLLMAVALSVVAAPCEDRPPPPAPPPVHTHDFESMPIGMG